MRASAAPSRASCQRPSDRSTAGLEAKEVSDTVSVKSGKHRKCTNPSPGLPGSVGSQALRTPGLDPPPARCAAGEKNRHGDRGRDPSNDCTKAARFPLDGDRCLTPLPPTTDRAGSSERGTCYGAGEVSARRPARAARRCSRSRRGSTRAASGCVSPVSSVARQQSVDAPAACGSQRNDQPAHAQRWSGSGSSSASAHVSPPSVLTSTRAIGARPDHARPSSSTGPARPSLSREEVGDAGRHHQRARPHPRHRPPVLLLGLPDPVAARHLVPRRTARSITVICASHFTFVIPYQPGTTSRSGKPCCGGSGVPFSSYASTRPASIASRSGRLRS